MPTFTFETHIERRGHEWPVSVTYTCDASGKIEDMSAETDDGGELRKSEWWQIDDEIADRIDDDLAQWLADQDCDDSELARPAHYDAGSSGMSAAHTPGPWDVVEATEHHGWYVTSVFGNTICDLYCMTRPDLPATINGGASRPVPFMHEMDGPNARLIAAAPDLLEALELLTGGLPSGAMFSERMAKARAAIAKARGAA